MPLSKARRAILLVDHGSRSAEANRVVSRVAGRLRKRLPACRVAFAHMELAPPSIGDAVDALVATGVEEIVVHPFFLSPGIHGTRDVPRLALAAARRHPGLDLRVTPPLGIHDALIDVIIDRVQPSRRKK